MDAKLAGLIEETYRGRWTACGRGGVSKIAVLARAATNFIETVEALNRAGLTKPIMLTHKPDVRGQAERYGAHFILQNAGWLKPALITQARLETTENVRAPSLRMRAASRGEWDITWGRVAFYDPDKNTWDASLVQSCEGQRGMSPHENPPLKTGLPDFLVRVARLVR